VPGEKESAGEKEKTTEEDTSADFRKMATWKYLIMLGFLQGLSGTDMSKKVDPREGEW